MTLTEIAGYMLLTPIVWWLVGMIYYNIIEKDGVEAKRVSVIVGLFGVLAYIGFLLLR